MLNKEKLPYSKFRLRVIFFIIFILVSLLIARLIYLTKLSPEDYFLSERNKIFARRGDIYDQNSRLLAVSDELYSVYANPSFVKSVAETSRILSELLDLSEDEIKSKLKSNRSFVWIKRQISPKIAEIIKGKKLSGISLQKEYKRLYPNKRVASHILGFCDIDGEGREGIEKGLNNYLMPHMKPGNYSSNVLSGDNVYLTIDSYIQAIAEKTVADAVKKEQASAASFILMDGKSGEIIAMANYPDFDPNNYRDYDQKDFRNISIFYQFEPGSVFKVFSIASLLDIGCITESDFFFCDGAYKDNWITINCTGRHGSINFYGIVKYSCNDAMIQAGLNISAKNLYKYLKGFGFGELTGVLLPGEQAGLLRDVNNWSAQSIKFISIGQEISINALQIVKAATVFINDGIVVSPLIVKRIVSPDGIVVKEFNRTEEKRVLKSGISSILIDAMKTACEPGGTVSRLKVKGINFAAKSGTAQVYDVSKKSYVNDIVTSSLLIVFPADNPRYVGYMVFHAPRGNVRWGGVIASYAFNYFFEMTGGYFDVDKKNPFYIDIDKLINREYKKIEKLPVIMPDLTGLTAKEVISIFENCNVNFKIKGSGRIVSHIPNAGDLIKDNDNIVLYLSD